MPNMDARIRALLRRGAIHPDAARFLQVLVDKNATQDAVVSAIDSAFGTLYGDGRDGPKVYFDDWFEHDSTKQYTTVEATECMVTPRLGAPFPLDVVATESITIGDGATFCTKGWNGNGGEGTSPGAGGEGGAGGGDGQDGAAGTSITNGISPDAISVISYTGLDGETWSQPASGGNGGAGGGGEGGAGGYSNSGDYAVNPFDVILRRLPLQHVTAPGGLGGRCWCRGW